MAHRGLLVPCCHFSQGARQVRLIEIYLYTIVYLTKEPRQLWLTEHLYPVVFLPKEPRQAWIIEIYLYAIVTLSITTLSITTLSITFK
jgi:hypothetical protein